MAPYGTIWHHAVTAYSTEIRYIKRLGIVKGVRPLCISSITGNRRGVHLWSSMVMYGHVWPIYGTGTHLKANSFWYMDPISFCFSPRRSHI